MSGYLNERGNITPKGVGMLLFLAVAAIVLLILVFGSWSIVKAGNEGVLIKLGAVQQYSLSEGFHWKAPFLHKIKNVNVQTQKAQVTADAASADLQQVTATIALNYHIQRGFAYKLYQDIGMAYKERVIDPAVEEAVKASTANFTAEELITKRQEVKAAAKDRLAAQLKPFYIVLDEFSIENFDFTPEFDAAIEKKVTAEQNALTAQHDLARVEFEQKQEIEKAKALAEKSRLEAQALSNTASAKNLIEKIEAEATLEFAKRWNGVLPNNWVIGGTVMDKLIQKFAQ